jgi:NTE family protein
MRLDPFDVRGNVGFLSNARRTLLPLPLVDRLESPPRDALPPFERRPLQAIQDARIAVVAPAGGAASVAVIGMARAFEEAGLRPAAIEARSASALWGAMWAGGLSADEMAERALSWRPQDVLGVQWTGAPRLALAALRGFSGLPKGAALEQLFDRHLWRMSAGQTEIPFHTLALNLDRGAVERLGSAATPDLSLGELARIAVAHRDRSEAVRVEGSFFVDARDEAELPVDADEFDHVVGPPLEDAGDGFYDVFLDRRRWPELIRRGHEAAGAALRSYG